MKKLRIIINPHTVGARSERGLGEALHLFSDADYEIISYYTRSRGDATRYAATYGSETDLLVVMGGDGTLNEAVGGLLSLPPENRPPVGYIPAGTCNDYASTLGLPRDTVKAAERILSGTPLPVDVGDFAGRQFMYIASFGAFTEASYATPQKAKNALGHFAYVLSGMNALPGIHPYHAEFQIDGEVLEDDWIFASVSNSTSVAGIVKLKKQLVCLSDGKFEVILVKYPRTPAELEGIAKAVLNHSLESPLITLRHAGGVWFSSRDKIHWTIDGEYEKGAPELFISANSNAVSIIR